MVKKILVFALLLAVNVSCNGMQGQEGDSGQRCALSSGEQPKVPTPEEQQGVPPAEKYPVFNTFPSKEAWKQELIGLGFGDFLEKTTFMDNFQDGSRMSDKDLTIVFSSALTDYIRGVDPSDVVKMQEILLLTKTFLERVLRQF